MQLDTSPASGTRDFLPHEVALRERLFATIRATFARFGFAPMSTPAFERLETLTGKYGDEGDQLVFKILRRGAHESGGESDLALRYDLTVPLARYVARHGGELGEPFKRHAIGEVWRADRPGHGRYREFTQCDLDTVGSDSLLADAEVVLAIDAVVGALGLDGVRIHLNARSALRGLVEAYGVAAGLESEALVALDKLDKVGVDGVAAELRERGVDAEAVALLAADLGGDDPPGLLRGRIERTERGRRGLAEVDEVHGLVAPHLRASELVDDPVLARGLSYYTGPVFELRHAGLGASIGGGGRYDDLVGMFSNRQIPATGGSLGLDRILLVLAEQDRAAADVPPVLVTVLDDDLRADALALATRVRAAGIDCDLYVASGRMRKQLSYADRRGHRLALIRGSDEVAAASVAVKDLASGEQVDVAEDEVVGHLTRRLAEPT